MPLVKTTNYVVECREDQGELKVFVKRIVDGQIVQPSGYVLGYNSLIYSAK